MKINITPDDDNDETLRALGRLGKTGANMRPMLSSIGFAMRENTVLRFRDSTAPDGSRWKALSPVTIALRRKGSSSPLVDTTDLKKSITYAVGVRDVVIGTNKKYAGTHQFGAKKGAYGKTKRGSPIPWGNVPARPFLGLSAGDKEEIRDIVHDAILDAIRGR